MGIEYYAVCQECLYEFILKKGGGMNWYQKVCNACGNIVDVPRMAPENVDGAMTKAQLIKHLSDRSGWSRKGGSFEPLELDIIEELTRECPCGGDLIRESLSGAYYRCPKCKGVILKITRSGMLYD